MDHPTGAVTFLFTDVEGSTKLAQSFPELYPEALKRHNEILKKAVEIHNGFVFKTVGDAFCCAFHNPADAIRSAIKIQKSLLNEKWNEVKIKVRIGIHSGKAEWNGNDYMGYITLARSSRVMSVAYGEQIIVSQDSYELVNQNSDSEIKYSFLDLGIRRLKDVIQPVKLYQIESSGLRENFPPLKTLDSRPNNLPIQLTSFIGFENEIRNIKNLLKKSKLVTILGTGGAGKTRLAIQVSADVIDFYSDGVWLTELASLTDPSNLNQEIMKVLSLKEDPEINPEDSLCNYLKEKETLIILDNCEHIIKDCAIIAEKLLCCCPDLKILITSREALKCNGEIIYRVNSLEAPDPNNKYFPEDLIKFDSVRLFVERALTVNPSFRLNEENAHAIAGICFQLDGIPLAIELAAARIKIMTVEKINERLIDRFNLLTGGKRTALPRQQTLRALIDWSYELLSEKEKILLQRLSVFTGGWIPEAAKEICTDDKILNRDTAELLFNLHDKSLINTKETDSHKRFYMLESIKQYSAEKLKDKNEIFLKHITYFRGILNFSEMISEDLPQFEWTILIENELNNIRSAIDRAITIEPDQAFEIVHNMSYFWGIKGYFTEGLYYSQKLLNADLNVSEINKANILYTAGTLNNDIGNITEAEKLILDSNSLYRKINFKEGIGNSLQMLGSISIVTNQGTAYGRKYYEEALTIFRELNLKADIANTLNQYSYIFNLEGDKEMAMNYLFQALEIYKEINDTHQVSLILATLAIDELSLCNYEKARQYAEESMMISKKFADNFLISINLVTLGSIHSNQMEYEKAFSLFDQSLNLMRDGGYKASMIVALKNLGEVSIKMSEYENAINYLKESLKFSSETGNYLHLSNTLYLLGFAYFENKIYENSLRLFLYFRKIRSRDTRLVTEEMYEKANELTGKIKDLVCKEVFENIENDISGMGNDSFFKSIKDWE